MMASKEELREMVPFWTKPYPRADWFTTDELIEIAIEASQNKQQGREFSVTFGNLIHIKSITEGKFPK